MKRPPSHLLILIVKQCPPFSILTVYLTEFEQWEMITLIKKYLNCVLLCLVFFHVQQEMNLSEQGLCQWDKVQTLFCCLITILCSLSTATAPVGIDNNNHFFPHPFFLQMDLQDLKVWKLLPSPIIKDYLSSFNWRKLQDIYSTFPVVGWHGLTTRAFCISRRWRFLS